MNKRSSETSGDRPAAWPAWPVPPGETERPIWTGHGFRIGGRHVPVLSFERGESGWDEESAKLLEIEAGADRPIGIASRRRAMQGLREAGALAPGKFVMEVGCANGYLLEEIRSNYPGVRVLGSDYAMGPLEKLAQRLTDVPLLQLDLTRSPLPDQFLDAIVLLNVLEHIEDDGKALRELRRMLKPRGAVVIEVPAGPSLFNQFDELVGHYRRYTSGELVGKLEEAGFTVDRRSHLGVLVYPAFWLLKKRNRIGRTSSEAYREKVVLQTLRSGNPNPMLKLLFNLEDWLQRWLPMPVGIRCVVTAHVR